MNQKLYGAWQIIDFESILCVHSSSGMLLFVVYTYIVLADSARS